ncbi:hypothetical protein CGMCC3_g9689 [Colletotrichum fructicola]|nr:uncharacterized protein CGMCC3_g9689 [Colletotrichum fructicola]KAE9574365.1 hypothetical protein CGMCC3_g9689 [Colletotrichum fructicola]
MAVAAHLLSAIALCLSMNIRSFCLPEVVLYWVFRPRGASDRTGAIAVPTPSRFPLELSCGEGARCSQHAGNPINGGL